MWVDLHFSRACGFPDFFPRAFVERDDVLLIDAVAVDDQQVLPENGRTAGTVLVLDAQRAVAPQHFAGFDVEASDAVGSVVTIKPAVFQNRRRRGVCVLHMYFLGVILRQHFDISQNPAGLQIDPHRPQAD